MFIIEPGKYTSMILAMERSKNALLDEASKLEKSELKKILLTIAQDLQNNITLIASSLDSLQQTVYELLEKVDA